MSSFRITTKASLMWSLQRRTKMELNVFLYYFYTTESMEIKFVKEITSFVFSKSCSLAALSFGKFGRYIKNLSNS